MVYYKERIRKTQGIDPLALVFFTEIVGPSGEPRQISNSLVKTAPESLLSKADPNLSNAYNAAPLKYLDLSRFMDCTPLGIQLKLPVELVIDLFTKLGPRCILVKENGRLHGIITKKDVLKHIPL